MSSAFQPRCGENTYPIGRFLVDRAKTLGLSRTELVRRLGYCNLGKGHRALSRLLLSGVVTDYVARHLAAALQVGQCIADEAIAATNVQRATEARTHRLANERAYREAFQPHLRVETARRIPQPIHMAAMFGTTAMRIIYLPEQVWGADEVERDRIVKEAILEHYRGRKGEVLT